VSAVQGTNIIYLQNLKMGNQLFATIVEIRNEQLSLSRFHGLAALSIRAEETVCQALQLLTLG
jgi:hypothetical protein